MLLSVYLATTIASITIDFTKSMATKKNLEKKGYIFSNEKREVNSFTTILSLVTPGLNVYNAYKLLTGEEKEVEEELLRRGTIYKPEGKTFSQVEQPKININTESQIQPTIKSKTYEEMSIEEKKEFLLKQRERIVSDLAATDEEINTLGRQR